MKLTWTHIASLGKLTSFALLAAGGVALVSGAHAGDLDLGGRGGADDALGSRNESGRIDEQAETV